MDVISVASHDTQSAVAAVPAEEEDFIFISCGTWSLFGTELAEPVIEESSYDCNLTNEGGCGYRTTFLKIYRTLDDSGKPPSMAAGRAKESQLCWI